MLAEREAETVVLSGELGLPLTRIGRFRAGSGVTVMRPDGTAFTFERTGYRHF
jgi:thiamine monophosphate kinase